MGRGTKNFCAVRAFSGKRGGGGGGRGNFCRCEGKILPTAVGMNFRFEEGNDEVGEGGKRGTLLEGGKNVGRRLGVGSFLPDGGGEGLS